MKKHFRKYLSMLLSSLMIVGTISDAFIAKASEENQIIIDASSVTGKSTSGHEASMIVDGSLDTYYQTPALSSEIDHMRYVDIALDGLYDISKITIYQLEGSYNHYQIYASETGTAYNKIAYKDDNVASTSEGETYTFTTPIKASKLRINLSFNSAGQQANLAEVKVYGEKVGEIVNETQEVVVSNFEDSTWKEEWDRFESDQEYANEKTVQEMSNLVGRVIGEEWKDDFIFEVKDYPSENDTYEIEQGENGTIIIRGNNGVAMASGFNHYLKYYCNVVYDPLFVSQLDMPDTLPEVDEFIIKETQYDVRYALNFCTYSYTMAFWDWGEYEAFLDWAAMSGINLVLDIVGQEEIVRRVLMEYGYTHEEVKEYIVGPGYFAWYYMQNMTSWGGPLPDQWFEQRVELGRKMHDRMQAYGITPVLSGFSGMVPLDFNTRYPDATIVSQGKWSEFARPNMLRVYVDEGKRDYFAELADVYYEVQKDVFGEITNYYAVDPFHEGGRTGDMNLTTVYQTVQSKMMEHDPDSVWVIQQWSGALNNSKLQGLVNKENALILDLSSEYNSYAHVMESNEVPWVWNMLHAFGGKPGMEANVPTISQVIPEAFENYNYMKGIGVTPESFSRCPMIYDMLWEMTWTKDPLDPVEWGHKYLERRYGAINDDMKEAWMLLLQTAYDCRINDIAGSLTNVRPRENFTSTSGGGRTNITYDVKQFEKVLKIYLDNYEQFKDSECFKYDLVDIARQVLSNSALDYHKLVLSAYRAGDKAVFDVYANHYLELIQLQNDVLATNDHFQVGTWIEQARTMLADADDWTKDLFEFNARCLITTWGGQQTSLVDYSYRGWAGIGEDYYLKRWAMWIDSYREALENGEAPVSINYFPTEWEWANRKSDEGYAYPTSSDSEDQLYTIASQIYDSYTVTNIDKIKQDIEESSYTNLLEGKLLTTTNSIDEASLKLLTDGDAGTAWSGQPSDWPVTLSYEFDSIVEIDEINFTLKSLVVSGLPVTYKVEVYQENQWKVLKEDTSGNIAGQISIPCSESIEKIRFTFNTVSSEEIPEMKEIMVYGKESNVEYVNIAKGLTATSSATLERPISYLTDEDPSTVWLANNGNSSATLTLPFESLETVEFVELYFEKAGLRFKFDVYGKNANGVEELLFSKGATNADMPSMYKIPVHKDICSLRIQYNGRDTGGQYYAAAFGFGEIRILANQPTHENVAKNIIPEVSSAFDDRPAYYLTDAKLDTYWLTNGNNSATVNLTLDEPTQIDYAELYMEKAGMRFIYDVVAIKEDGSEEVVFKKEATNADMPYMYRIPVNQKIKGLRIDYLGRDSGGQFAKAGFGFAEIRLLKPLGTDEIDPSALTNIALNASATSTNLETNETVDASVVIDNRFDTFKEYIGVDYAFPPVKYVVDLHEECYVDSVVTNFEKAGLRFKFKVEVEDEAGNITTVLDMSENTQDMAQAYTANVKNNVRRVIVSVLERADGGSFYAAANRVYEIEIFGKANSIASKATINYDGELDLTPLTDGDKETGVDFNQEDAKVFNFKFAKAEDIGSINITMKDGFQALKYKLSYKDEDGQWKEYVDASANLTAHRYYLTTFNTPIYTDEIMLEVLNDEVSMNEVEIFRQSAISELLQYISSLEKLIGNIAFGDYAGNYEQTAYDAFQNKVETLRKEGYEYNSKEVALAKDELTQSYIVFMQSYVSINRSPLLKALLDAKTLAPTLSATRQAKLEEAITINSAVYDTYKVTQVELDNATLSLRNVMEEVTSGLSKVENVNAVATNYKTITLTWDADENATSYVVERLSGEEWIPLATTTDNTYVHTGVKTGKAYTYRVKAMNDKTEGEYSEVVSATTALTGEVELSIANNGNDKFDLTWSGVEGATRYIIYRKTADGEWKKVLTLGKDARSYTSSKMLPNTYSYQVKAGRYDSVDRVMTNGSNIVEGIIGVETMNPTNLVITQDENGVTFTWDKVAGMPFYEVYRSKNGGVFRHMKNTTTTSITTSLLKSGIYQYKLRAYTLVNGEKVYSQEVVSEVFTIE